MAGEYQKVQQALTKLLDNKFPDIPVFADTVGPTGEAAGPDGPMEDETYFFVDVQPVSISPAGPVLHEYSVLVDIVLGLKGRSKKEYLGKAEEIDALFRPAFVFDGRAITVHTREPRITDGLLHYKFAFSYRPEVEDGRQEPPMGELVLNTDWRK